jgi:hypothetical protein
MDDARVRAQAAASPARMPVVRATVMRNNESLSDANCTSGNVFAPPSDTSAAGAGVPHPHFSPSGMVVTSWLQAVDQASQAASIKRKCTPAGGNCKGMRMSMFFCFFPPQLGDI